jgi:hypothetical protein
LTLSEEAAVEALAALPPDVDVFVELDDPHAVSGTVSATSPAATASLALG